MKRTFAITEMHNWDYGNVNCIELKYEDLIKDEKKYFHNVFEHYGFNTDAIDKSLEFVNQYSFKTQTGHKPGQISKTSHLHSGLAAQWKNIFTEEN